MAAFNTVNMGNKMVLQSARGKKSNSTAIDEEDRGTCGCLWKSKSKPKGTSEKERIKQFSIWFEEQDVARQKIFAQRRFDREYRRELLRKKARYIRKLFIPTGICWLVGFMLTMASTVQSLGEGTVFWNERDKFQIIGPSVLGVGLLLLMITEGFISNQQIKSKKLEAMDLTKETTIVVEPASGKQDTIRTISNKLQRLNMKQKDVATETEPFLKEIDSAQHQSTPQSTSYSFNTKPLPTDGTENASSLQCRQKYTDDKHVKIDMIDIKKEQLSDTVEGSVLLNFSTNVTETLGDQPGTSTKDIDGATGMLE